MVTGQADDHILKNVLGWGMLDKKDINETIGFIETKYMASHAMTQPAINFLFPLTNLWNHEKSSDKTTCSMCGESADKFVCSRNSERFPL